MHVPPVVESGKQPHVILDCDYDLTENEGRQVREDGRTLCYDVTMRSSLLNLMNALMCDFGRNVLKTVM